MVLPARRVAVTLELTFGEIPKNEVDVVAMLHTDGQCEPGLIPGMIEPIVNGEANLVLGSLLVVPGWALDAGMPRWKFSANCFLTEIENSVMSTHLTEAHTGYRAYSRKPLLEVSFLRNSLDFDYEVLMQASHMSFRIAEVPAPCRYFDNMSSVGFKTGVVYGLKTRWTGVRLVPHRRHILPSRKFKT